MQMDKYKDFLDAFSKKMQAEKVAETETGRVGAPDFSVFRYIDLGENKSSQIIADLLDPDGVHGQGSLFLESFLEACGLDKDFFPRGDKVYVSCEAPTYSIPQCQRRMDILIRAGQKAIVVENKIAAADQPHQAADYLCHLENIARQDFRLVYLHPCGARPSEESLPAEVFQRYKLKVLPLAWSGLLNALEGCNDRIKSQNVQAFVMNFLKAMRKHSYLKSEHEESGTMEKSNKELTDFILEKAETLEAACGCYNSFMGVVGELILKRCEKIKKDVSADPVLKVLTVTSEPSAAKDACLLQAKFSDEDIGIAVRIESFAANFNKVQIGFKWIKANQDNLPVKQAKEKIPHFISGLTTPSASQVSDKGDSWPWFHGFEPPWDDWSRKEAVLAMNDPQAVTVPESEFLSLCRDLVHFKESLVSK